MKAIFAGTFDPPTLGHWDVVEGAAPLFEKLYIVIATNTAKKPLLDVVDRVKVFNELIANSKFSKKCEVITAPGLVADLCKTLGVEYLVRGIRSSSDLERELPMSVANEMLANGVKTILIPSTKEHSFVSSTLVREIAILGGDVSPFVPSTVSDYLLKGKK
ncbi:MAG: pantetheine-phosphate adenylyltransferase [Bdellovibrionota bacterium]